MSLMIDIRVWIILLVITVGVFFASLILKWNEFLPIILMFVATSEMVYIIILKKGGKIKDTDKAEIELDPEIIKAGDQLHNPPAPETKPEENK